MLLLSFCNISFSKFEYPDGLTATFTLLDQVNKIEKLANIRQINFQLGVEAARNTLTCFRPNSNWSIM